MRIALPVSGQQPVFQATTRQIEQQERGSMSRRIVILGSTGSIGRNALAVVRSLRDRLCVVGLAAGQRGEMLAEQAAEFGASWAYAADETARYALPRLLPASCRALADNEELCARVADPDVDMVLCAIVGTAGLKPVLSAIRAGKDIALASKEVLVLAGELVMAEARRCGVRILPVDSEHCALFQCLAGESIADIRRLIITASGGPFRARPDLDLSQVTPEMALAHPTWNMGRKITIDSATLMNKGLEVIEARWLFDVCPDQIETVIHPQSIVHSMLEFCDGSILAQMGCPDMRLPIQYCLTYPERLERIAPALDFSRVMELRFEPPDHERFPAIRLAKEALRGGGTLPAVYNAANEAAVERFCAGTISFPRIWETVAATMQAHTPLPAATLEDILAADAWARQFAAGL